MLTTIETFSKKSFKNYSLASHKLSFKMKNLIFGYNGRGKSSLATAIVDEYKKQNGENSFRLFNRDYINDNLIVEDNSTIKGVKAVFGEKEVDAAKKIEAKKLEIQDEKTPLEEIGKLRTTTKQLIDQKHNDRKGKLNIKTKPMTSGGIEKTLEDIISLYKNDIKEAKKLEPDEDMLRRQKGDDELTKRKTRIENLSIPDFSFTSLSPEDLNQLENIYRESFGDVSIPSSTIISWMEKGVEIHHEENDSTQCLFCGSDFSLVKVEEEIKAYNENQKLQSEKILSDFLEKIKECKTKIDIFSESEENYNVEFDNTIVRDVKRAVDMQSKELSDLISQLEKKIFEMSRADTFDKQHFEEIVVEINSQYEKITEYKKEILENLQEQISHQDTLVKGAIGLSVVEDSGIAENITTINQKQEQFVTIQRNNKKLNNEISELESSSSDYEDFRKFLNEVLKDVEIDLELVSSEDQRNYVLRHSVEKDCRLTLEDISEGEKNLLALLFFYFELYSDDRQEKLKSEIQLIVIDDPISSLDDSNRFYVLELMKKVFGEEKQVFIFTHSWDDFCQLGYKYRKNTGQNETVNFWEVYKAGSLSQIREVPSSEKPYKKLFQEIYSFSQNTDLPDESAFFHIPNSMRRVFEEFLNFKSSGDIIPTNRQQVRIEEIIISATDEKKLNGAECRNGSYLSTNKKQKLSELLSVINVFSHESGNNPEEIHRAAKFMMNLIKDMDSTHFNAMKV